jgi:hypothetical protein
MMIPGVAIRPRGEKRRGSDHSLRSFVLGPAFYDAGGGPMLRSVRIAVSFVGRMPLCCVLDGIESRSPEVKTLIPHGMEYFSERYDASTLVMQISQSRAHDVNRICVPGNRKLRGSYKLKRWATVPDRFQPGARAPRVSHPGWLGLKFLEAWR